MPEKQSVELRIRLRGLRYVDDGEGRYDEDTQMILALMDRLRVPWELDGVEAYTPAPERQW